MVRNNNVRCPMRMYSISYSALRCIHVIAMQLYCILLVNLELKERTVFFTSWSYRNQCQYLSMLSWKDKTIILRTLTLHVFQINNGNSWEDSVQLKLPCSHRPTLFLFKFVRRTSNRLHPAINSALTLKRCFCLSNPPALIANPLCNLYPQQVPSILTSKSKMP